MTPRTTRLVRVTDLRAFREAAVSLACHGSPFEARDRLVVVPTHAAGAHLVRSIENRRLGTNGAVLLPDVMTPGELPARFAARLPRRALTLTAAEREVLLGAACRAARDEGADPPFRLRPGLIAEILRFYDTLQRHQKGVDTFERLALATLEAGAAEDRGAERLVRQTRFLVSAFRHFQHRCEEAGALDEQALRREVIATPAARPWRHVVVTVGDCASDPYGLFPDDWDLLARVPGLERLDVVATDSRIGAFHERIHQVLPGIEEVRYVQNGERRDPVLLVPPRLRREAASARPAGDAVTHAPRDREEEVAGFARRVKYLARSGEVSLDRMALVVRQPLPYVYIARDVFGSAGIPSQLFDTLPLAAEPYAAALDLVFALVDGNFARAPAVALLRSPHFHVALGAHEIAAVDRALGDMGYLGDVEALERLPPRAAAALGELARELVPLRSPAPAAQHLTVLISFLTTHEHLPRSDDPLRERHLRARGAVLGTLMILRDAYARFDPLPVELDVVAATVRRWIEAQTFAPRTGDAGVHLVDAASAPYGDFDLVQLAGLVDGEWPDRPRRNIFYSPGLLRELGWPSESARLDGERAAFCDLLHLPSSRLVISTFMLEDDGIVGPSSLIDEVKAAGLETVEEATPAARIFAHEALGLDPVDTRALGPIARAWAARRLQAPPPGEAQFHGRTSGHAPDAYSLSALERYQDCPFKYFAGDVLGLEEPPEDEPMRSPRARGRFVHEVFRRFFEAWDARGGGTITPDRVEAARAMFGQVATPMLAQLSDVDASLERARLFGSAISMGIVDVVLGLEASRPVEVRTRWLEYRLEGDFSLGTPDGRRVRLKGVADRIDLLAGDRLRVIDYKSGHPPNPKRALQVPVYALCAQERLGHRAIDEASYVAFSGKRALVPVVKAGASDPDAVLVRARDRLFAAVDGIAAGQFPPRPYDPMICSYCAYASVCRKDYVDSE